MFKNPYENDEETKSVDIPNFVADEDNGESTSVDMSLFQMSDDELYGKYSDQDEDSFEPNHKKSNIALIIAIAFACLFFVLSAVSIFYALNEHKKVTTLDNQVSQLKALNSDYQTKYSNLQKQLEELEKQIQEQPSTEDVTTDPDNKYPKGTILYITKDGQGMVIKTEPNMSSATISGSKRYVDWGDKVTLIADAIIDADGNYWGQIDKGYIRIIYKGEVWASTKQQ